MGGREVFRGGRRSDRGRRFGCVACCINRNERDRECAKSSDYIPDGCSNACVVESGFQCVSQGAGSCTPIRKLFITSTSFTTTATAGGFGAIDTTCKAQFGSAAFFCNRADITSRVNAGQADPAIFGLRAWIRDPIPIGGRPGTCLNLTYNSGHLDDAQRIIVTANGAATSTEVGGDCGAPASFRGHCCMP